MSETLYEKLHQENESLRATIVSKDDEIKKLKDEIKSLKKEIKELTDYDIEMAWWNFSATMEKLIKAREKYNKIPRPF